jgi:hypothetical protein
MPREKKITSTHPEIPEGEGTSTGGKKPEKAAARETRNPTRHRAGKAMASTIMSLFGRKTGAFPRRRKINTQAGKHQKNKLIISPGGNRAPTGKNRTKNKTIASINLRLRTLIRSPFELLYQ